jgi:isopenicillin N synthase-like dioxygenase
VTLTTGDPPYLRLHGPNLWAAALPELRPAVLRWLELLRSVSQRLMAAIAGSIGLSDETFAAGYSGRPHERLKIIKYPPVSPEPPGRFSLRVTVLLARRRVANA